MEIPQDRPPPGSNPGKLHGIQGTRGIDPSNPRENIMENHVNSVMCFEKQGKLMQNVFTQIGTHIKND